MQKTTANEIGFWLPWMLLFSMTIISPIIREIRLNHQLTYGPPAEQRQAIAAKLETVDTDVEKLNQRLKSLAEQLRLAIEPPKTEESEE